LSDAYAISYIQYIGVVIAGLTSAGIAGGRPNSPIGILLKPLFAPQHTALLQGTASIRLKHTSSGLMLPENRDVAEISRYSPV
jgi:hypothetical protein